MKKIKAPQPIAAMTLSNTAAVFISEIDDQGDFVKYYLNTADNDTLVKLHKAKIYYRADGAPYFNSLVGRMQLGNFIKC